MMKATTLVHFGRHIIRPSSRVVAGSGCLVVKKTLAAGTITRTVAACGTSDTLSFLSLSRRTFANKATKRKRKKERDKQLRHNAWRAEQKRKSRMKNLHPAAKMKRIISACDYWFSQDNLDSDAFLQEECSIFGGQYVRITTLASFPKLEGWTDVNLVVQALSDPSVDKRYTVVYNQEFVERALRNQQRQARRNKQQEKEDARIRKKEQKERKRANKLRRRKLQAYVDDTREAYFRPIWQEHVREMAQLYAEEQAKEQEEEEARRRDELAAMSTMERLVDAVQTVQKNIMESFQKQKEDDKDEEEGMDWSLYWDGYYEEDLQQENEEFAEAVSELQHFDDLEEAEWHDRNWDRRMDREMAQYLPKDRSKKDRSNNKLYSHIKIDKDDDLVDEELSFPVVDDGSNLEAYALVQHKRLKGGYFGPTEYDEELIDEMDDNDENWEHLLYQDENYDGVDDYFAEEEEPPKPKKQATLPRYKSERSIHVIRTPKKLRSFCAELRQSLQRSNVAAVGFDVEYCTLEMDIRNTLPAMLQLASPEPDGPVGLIWLDKFPNHGKDMLSDHNGDYKELLSILNDSSLSKVGVGASKDAWNLAQWWGVTDRGFVNHFISPMLDLENEVDDNEEDDQKKVSLKDLCASVLQKNLPKLKEKNSRAKKSKRKKGRRVKTSHWRRDDLTKTMKAYAADDASCSIDVWLQLKEQEEAASVEEEAS